jgi:beta-glucosidase
METDVFAYLERGVQAPDALSQGTVPARANTWRALKLGDGQMGFAAPGLIRSPWPAAGTRHVSPSPDRHRSCGAHETKWRRLMIAVGLFCPWVTAMTSPVPAASVPEPTRASVHPEIWPSPKWPLPRDAALEQRVQSVLKKMTLEEKIGQIVQADIGSVTPDDARKYHLGSILNGGNSGPGGDDLAPPAKWLALADAFYAASVDKTGGRAGIPLLWGTDAIHGHSNIVGATLFPQNVGLGAMHDPALMAKIAAATATEVRTTGPEWTFAPTVAVPQDVRWGRSYEGYSEDPDVVASYTGTFVRALQGEPGAADFLKPPHVLATTKHFLADGGTDQGRDQGDARIPETTLRDVHAAGYPPALAAGVQTVMASFSSWNGVKISGHEGLLTDVLKGRMNFEGFVVSDWNAHGQIPGCTTTNCPQALNAGLDMYMAPDSWRGLYDSLLQQARTGVVSLARLDDAVTRILRVKMRMGLFEAGPPSKRPYGGRFEQLGHPEHRAIARAAVRESLVLLKNQNGLLPLKAMQRVLVVGDGADSIAKQSGGWTLTWQGAGLANTLFPGATSIWQGLRAAVTAAGGQAELSADGNYRTRPDVAIIVFGENPYAEFQGDLAYLQLREGNDAHLATMQRMRAEKIPVVAVFLSGRPLWMNRELNASDAFVAAWLPGSEGAGVADVLLRKPDGSVAYDFNGRLSFSWPRLATYDAHKHGQEGYNPLFALGYGLRYGQNGNLASLPENSGAAESSDQNGVLFSRGKLGAPWMLSYTDEKGGVQPISTVPSSVAGGRVNVTRIDRTTQEDTLRFEWLGLGMAGVALDSRQSFDFSRETNGEVALVLDMRVAKAPTSQVDVGMACGPECGGVVRLDSALTQASVGQWRRVAIPLKCFASSGADMRKITRGLSLSTAGALDIAVSRIALSTEFDQAVTCAR